MKKFSFEVHYDMVIHDVQVVAESEQEARQMAYDKAARFPLESMECVGKDACLGDTMELTALETKSMTHEAIIQFVHRYVDDIAIDRERKQEFADMVFNRHKLSIVPWANGLGSDYPDWQRKIFLEATSWYNPFGMLCNRYARLYAHKSFVRRYKNTGKSLFDIDVKGCDKLQKKQAVIDAMQVLCDRMEDYVVHQDDEDFKGWEPQMVIRYESETGDEDNYWNLFLYCTGPNDRNDDDYLAVSMAWQHVWTDEDGKDATDDYGTREYQTRTALLRHLFYDEPEKFEETDETPIWERITDVWVD